jgi:hypothetical protein
MPVPRWLSGRPWRAIERFENERACWVVLGLAIALSAALGLWLTRGTTLYTDEYVFFVSSRGFDPNAILSPENGHLIAVPRLIYATVFKLFGADYLVLRLLEVLGVALVGGLFFALAKRKVGALVALAPSLVLLFLGSAWEHSLSPEGITHLYCLAAGLGALLALAWESRPGDVAACALLTVSVATFSIGLAFLAGVALSVLLRGDRWRRAWIFLIPLVLYGAWLLAAPKLHAPGISASTGVKLSNAELIPNYAADAAAAVTAAVAGLSYDFSQPASTTISSSWGYLLAALAAAALVLRLRRGSVPAALWTSLAILVAFWASTALATKVSREPNQQRYMYAGAVLVLLVATDALRGIRLPPGARLALFAAVAVALATNLAQLRAGSNFLRGSAPSVRAELTAIELARDRVDPGFVPAAPGAESGSFGFGSSGSGTPSVAPAASGQAMLTFLALATGGAGPYLAAVDRNGSFAFSLPELRGQSESVRELADSTVSSALRLTIAASPAPPPRQKCLRLGGHGPGPVVLTLRPPGVLLRSASAAAVTLNRFAAFPTARVGNLPPGRFAALRIPTDRAPEPWHAFVSTAGPLMVCPIGGAVR